MSASQEAGDQSQPRIKHTPHGVRLTIQPNGPPRVEVQYESEELGRLTGFIDHISTLSWQVNAMTQREGGQHHPIMDNPRRFSSLAVALEELDRAIQSREEMYRGHLDRERRMGEAALAEFDSIPAS